LPPLSFGSEPTDFFGDLFFVARRRAQEARCPVVVAQFGAIGQRCLQMTQQSMGMGSE
jgi:hypothetical protein